MEKTLFEAVFRVASRLERAGLPQGVEAVTVGYKRTAGETTEKPALVFLVRDKRTLENLHPSALVPFEIGGIATDVVEIRAEPHDGGNAYQRVEPLVGGVSIKADLKRGIGTLGGIFRDTTTGLPVGVTNRHVVDNWFIRANGQAVYQPSEEEGNRIGTVTKHSKYWDCAAISIDPKLRSVDLQRSFLGQAGQIVEIDRALVDMHVVKVGARTGLTRGVVLSSGPRAVEIRPRGDTDEEVISDHGDSGALWCAETPSGFVAVALHWGGANGVALGKPMPEVAKFLGIEVLRT